MPPIFDYACLLCNNRFEVMTDHKYKNNVTCPECLSDKTEKQLSAPHVGNQFKKAWDRQPPSNPTKVYIKR